MFKNRSFIKHPTITKNKNKNKELKFNVINVKNENHLTSNIRCIIIMKLIQ